MASAYDTDQRRAQNQPPDGNEQGRRRERRSQVRFARLSSCSPHSSVMGAGPGDQGSICYEARGQPAAGGADRHRALSSPAWRGVFDESLGTLFPARMIRSTLLGNHARRLISMVTARSSHRSQPGGDSNAQSLPPNHFQRVGRQRSQRKTERLPFLKGRDEADDTKTWPRRLSMVPGQPANGADCSFSLSTLGRSQPACPRRY